MTQAYTRPGSTNVDYNAVTGDSVTGAARKLDAAIGDIYSQVQDGSTIVKGVLQLGTGATNAAQGNHTHSGLVTNGDSHDHSGGDGAQIAYSTLSGTPDLTAYCLKSGNLSGLADYYTARTNIGVDTLSRRNRLCNGDFRVDNINAGAAVTPAASAYVVDNLYLQMSWASKLTAQRIASALTGFPYSEKFTVASAFTSGAADLFLGWHTVEGLDFADLMWGTANAKPITVSLVVKVSVPGVYSFAVRNAAATRSYVFTKTLIAGENAVTQTIPGCTDGVWNTGAASCVSLLTDLGCGSNMETTAGAWQAGNYCRVAGTVSFVANAGATYEISGIQIEKGSFATPFEVLPYEQAKAWCQRYHPTVDGPVYLSGHCISATEAYVIFPLKVAPRIDPTGLVTTVSGNLYNAATASALTGIIWVNSQNLIKGTVASGLVAGHGTMLFNTNSIRLTGAEL